MTLLSEPLQFSSDDTATGGVGHVTLVGAGPGDPDLLTVKAANALRNATLVLYDNLVSKAVLELVPAGTSHNVARMIVHGNAQTRLQFSRTEVRSLLQAQFSMPYCLAVAAESGRATLDQFEPLRTDDAEVRRLMSATEIRADRVLGPKDYPSLEVVYRDGTRRLLDVPLAKGAPEVPIEDNELREKARSLLVPVLGAERVICWATILMLPLSLPGAALTWPQAPVAPAAWGGFVYVGLFSMWAAFFAWYRALDIGGAVLVSQLQVLQPFFAIAFAVPLLGESVDATTLGFALAVIASVVLGRWANRRALRPGAT